VKINAFLWKKLFEKLNMVSQRKQRLMAFSNVSHSVLHLCQQVQQAGGRALLVGGWVRDQLRGQASVDYDIEVYALEPAKLKALLESLGQVNAVGEAFTVYKVKLSRQPAAVSQQPEEETGRDSARSGSDGVENPESKGKGQKAKGKNEDRDQPSAIGSQPSAVSHQPEKATPQRGDTANSKQATSNSKLQPTTDYRLPTTDYSELSIDVSLPRRESKTGRGHRAFEVIGDPWMTFEEAARRRDFTINAMMYDPLTDELIDPFNGRRDLENKILRAVDSRTFAEDSLRVLRAMQFAARFEYDIEQSTVALCRGIDLSDLPAERILAEVVKWLLQSDKPSIGWWAARKLGIIEKLWPECHALIDCPQEYEWHPEGDVFIHTGMVLDEARKLIDDLPFARQMAVMLGALCHDFGKPPTTKFEDGRIRSKGHEDAGVEPTQQFLERLNVHTLDGYDVRQQVKALVQYHLSPAHFHKSHLRGNTVSDGAFRRLAQRVEPDLLYRVARADCLGRTGDFSTEAMDWFIERVRELAIEHKAPEPLLKGRHVLELGLKPGPQVGQITKAVYEMQLDGRVTTLEQAIAAASEMLPENH
jgi:tRNA nucleotidyltransferase (CCA-adding enzyme)